MNAKCPEFVMPGSPEHLRSLKKKRTLKIRYKAPLSAVFGSLLVFGAGMFAVYEEQVKIEADYQKWNNEWVWDNFTHSPLADHFDVWFENRRTYKHRDPQTEFITLYKTLSLTKEDLEAKYTKHVHSDWKKLAGKITSY